MATYMQYSFDFCLAWALIGEWTSRILFPVSKGPWPRHGHAGALLPEYRARSLRMVVWARAAFEQGALPSLLLLQGLVPVFTLPRDKMFQSTGISQGRQRPTIMHAYGGAKNWDVQSALRSIASMVVRRTRPNVGKGGASTGYWHTTVDIIKVTPLPLEDRELDLLLSCWTRWNTKSVPGCALNTWLSGVDCEFGPDAEDSSHLLRCAMCCEVTGVHHHIDSVKIH